MKRALVLCMALLAEGVHFSRCMAVEQGPWSSNSKHPVLEEPLSVSMAETRAADNQGRIGGVLSIAIRLFQAYISPVDGDRCTMTPTCSHYGLDAIRRHGPFIGCMMTTDRIVHEYEEQRFAASLWDGTRFRFYDPVEANDFWFSPSGHPPADGPRPDGE